MSVLIVTSLGDIVVDLHTDRCPLTTKNFLKLCKMKYYNGCLFHKVEKDFLAQTGDRTGTGTGGESVYKYLYGDQARFFDDEIHPDLKHKKIGTVAMASAGENGNASQFYFTLREDLDYLDGKHTVFGIVEEQEGLDTLTKINESFIDENGRPYKNIRIKHTYILDDPFPDPPQLTEFIPEKSPEGKPDDEIAEERLEDNWVPLDETLGAAELEELLREREAHTNAAILESIGDIPDADIKPPENVLFVCKLNPVTQDEDLHTIFSRFGTVVSADIIRDFKTGDSLCYAFIEFETNEACELAYIKMDNTLIDDRRIHVDFSQSVSKLWGQFRQGKRSAGNGCFKCGATDHIAKDCDEGGNKKDNHSNYVLKSGGDTQRGGGRKNYDMVFDEDEPAKPHKSSDDTRSTKRHKTDTSKFEELRQKSGSTQVSDSRSRRSGPDHGNATREVKDSDEKRFKQPEHERNDKVSDHREYGGRNGDRRDRYDNLSSRRGRDSEERNKDREKESRSRREYEERKSDRYSDHREASRHHHSDRRERYSDVPRRRSPETERKKYESDRYRVDQDKEEQKYRSRHSEDNDGKEKRHKHEHRR